MGIPLGDESRKLLSWLQKRVESGLFVVSGRKEMPREPLFTNQIQPHLDQTESLLQGFLTFLGHLEVTCIPIISLETWFPKRSPRCPGAPHHTHRGAMGYFIYLFLKLIFLAVELLYNVVLVSTVRQNESAIHMSPPFWTSFPFRSPQCIR